MLVTPLATSLKECLSLLQLLLLELLHGLSNADLKWVSCGHVPCLELIRSLTWLVLMLMLNALLRVSDLEHRLCRGIRCHLLSWFVLWRLSMNAHMPLDVMMSWLMAPCFVARHALPLILMLIMLIVLRIFTISVNLTRIAFVTLEILKTDLNALHFFQKLLQGDRVQSGLKVNPLRNISELGQVRIH